MAAKKAFGQGKSRRNPSGGKSMPLGERAKRTLMTAVVSGVGATATLIVLDKFINKYTWKQEYKGLAKIGIGLTLAIAAGYVIPTVPGIAAGLAIGGSVAGMRDLYGRFIMPRLESSSPTCPAVPTNPTRQQAIDWNAANPHCPPITVPAAGAYPFLGAGKAPAGQQQTQGAACGL